MAKLTETQFKATFADPMKRIDPAGDAPIPFWEYFDEIPAEDFCGHDCSEEYVEYVWRDPRDRYEHVLVNSNVANVFMVLVLDLQHHKILGHRLLDLNHEYGLSL